MAAGAVDGRCPLVAVRGVTGGAGTTSLAFALACEATATSGRPALIAETEGPGLETVAGVRSPVGLNDLPALTESGPSPGGVWAEAFGTRVLTGSPRPEVAPAALTRAIDDARCAHSLVVLDGGASSEPCLSEAVTDTIWVATASATGLERAAAQLKHTPATGCVLAVVAVHGSNVVRTRDVRQVARGVCDALVLVPHDPELLRSPRLAHDRLRPAAADLLSAVGHS